jgi:hypothetical protein
LYLAFYLAFFLFYLSSEVNMDDGSSHHRAHADVPEDPEEFLHGVIRGDITYVPEYAGDDEDDVDSWMNPSATEGLELDPFDDEGQTNKDSGVYIYLGSGD